MTYEYGPWGRRPTSDEPGVSVIVPAYNGQSTIAATLQSIERALHGRTAEIIVSDSSEDSTPEVVRSRFPHVRLLRSATRLTAGEARNRGADAARGRLLFFTDQDCSVPPDWLDRLEAHLADPSIAGAGGSVGVWNPENASGCALYFLEFLYHFPCREPARRNHRFLVGCNAVYRAEVLRAVRFPDRTLGEDVLFADRVRQAGFTTVYDASIQVLHWNREGWGSLLAYNDLMGRAAAEYHSEIRERWVRPFLRRPELAFVAPIAILPRIALSLARCKPSYLWRFALVSPMCLLGNLAWARGFRAGVIALATRAPRRIEPRPPAFEATVPPAPLAGCSPPIGTNPPPAE